MGKGYMNLGLGFEDRGKGHGLNVKGFRVSGLKRI
jgi:hypothetical protein